MATYNAVQAARLCGVSVRTIYRKTAELESQGAWRDASRQWHIPVTALLGVGFTPGQPARPDTPTGDGSDTFGGSVCARNGQPAAQAGGDILMRQPEGGVKPTADTADTTASELDQLRAQVRAWRKRAELAETAHIELQAQAAQVPELLRRAEVAETASAGWQRLAAAQEKTILALETAPRPDTPQSPPDAHSAPRAPSLPITAYRRLADRLRRFRRPTA